MGSQPHVTFITAAYNAKATLAAMIDSALDQTSQDWELIVVDDGSSDGTAAVAESFAASDPRIAVIRQANAGTAAARNAGARWASGRFWCYLDADDMLEPNYVADQTAFAKAHPGFDIYSCNAWLLLRSGARRRLWRGREYARPFSLTVEDQLRESSIVLMSLVTPRLVELTNGFRDLHSEDYDFWLRASILGATHIYNPATLAVYRRRVGSKTTDMVAEAESFLRIHRDALEMPELTEGERAVCRQAIGFDEARIERRKSETALLGGDFRGARAAYLKTRKAYPNAVMYVVGLAVVMVSPRLYAYVKKRRLI